MARDAETRAREDRLRELQVRSLADLLDDPNTTQDERLAIHSKIGELAGEKKQGGLFDLIGRMLHGGGQKQPDANPLAGILGMVQKRNDTPVSQGVTTVPGRMDIQMAPVPGTEERGTETVDATKYIINKPTRYGEQTNQQLTDRRALDLFGQQQDIKARHDAENDARTKETTLARAQALGENAIKLAQANNAARQTRLDDQQLFQLTKERDALYQSYLGGGLDPTTAMTRANEEYVRKYTSLADSREAQTKLANAQADAIPVRLELQRRGIELREYKTDADIDVAYQGLAKDLNAQQRLQFESEAKPLFDQLKQIRAAREQVARAKATNVYTMGTPANADAAIEAFDKRADEIQKQIDAARGRYSPITTTIPQRPQRRAAGAAPRTYTEADVRARAKAQGKDEAEAVRRAREAHLIQ